MLSWAAMSSARSGQSMRRGLYGVSSYTIRPHVHCRQFSGTLPDSQRCTDRGQTASTVIKPLSTCALSWCDTPAAKAASEAYRMLAGKSCSHLPADQDCLRSCVRPEAELRRLSA